MELIKSIPRGYCHGVVNALNMTSKTIQKYKDDGPVYILGEIVHNSNISKAFTLAGAIILTGGTREKLLDEINEGTVIITAHGINPNLIIKAKEKGLNVVDATCKDVYKTHNVIKEHLNKGYDIIYIGKKSHPEPEGVLGIDSSIKLVSNKEDIQNLNITNRDILVTNQTTMSKYDIQELFNFINQRFPSATILEEICEATSTRQDIAKENSKKADLTFVVGDAKSNNTNRLVEICQKLGNCPTYRIDTVEDIDINVLLDKKVNIVHITSGASTPTLITSEIISFLENFNKDDNTTWDNSSKIELKKLIPRIK